MSDSVPALEWPCRELRRRERTLDRSRRATNPESFDRRGCAKKWNRSRRHQRLSEKERERRLAAERKRGHDELANRILAQGKTTATERLSCRAFQRCFARPAKVRGAGTFIADRKRSEGAVRRSSSAHLASSRRRSTT
ncbi:MAG TPA: hypothetical protein VMK12_31270 [Anaeromyxobacteraceae bacterium]|nr:hypothetical protein [Anaeromyxobacteraceae bacterium]